MRRKLLPTKNPMLNRDISIILLLNRFTFTMSCAFSLIHNSSPRPPEALQANNANESLPPSQIPVADNDSLMEEIDLFLADDGSFPPRDLVCRDISSWMKGRGSRDNRQKDRKPSQNDKTEHGMEKTVQNQGQSPKMPKSESILKNQHQTEPI
ncbi:hypothetical protein Tco_1145964 [Tanacetum coccineum]